jgi:hypothetical protein
VSEFADAVIADGSPIPHRLVRKPLSADELADAVVCCTRPSTAPITATPSTRFEQTLLLRSTDRFET